MSLRLDCDEMSKSHRERLKEILKEKSILRGDFTLASGKKSTYYIDARLTTLDAEGVNLIGKIFLEEIKQGFIHKYSRRSYYGC